MHNQVLMQKLAADGHDPGEITLYECTVSGWGEDRVKCGMIRHARNPTDERSENIAAQVRPEACRCIFCWSSHSYDLVRKRPVHRPAAGSENVHADNE